MKYSRDHRIHKGTFKKMVRRMFKGVKRPEANGKVDMSKGVSTSRSYLGWVQRAKGREHHQSAKASTNHLGEARPVKAGESVREEKAERTEKFS